MMDNLLTNRQNLIVLNVDGAKLNQWTWKMQDATDPEAPSILDSFYLLEGTMYSTGVEKQSADLLIYKSYQLQ